MVEELSQSLDLLLNISVKAHKVQSAVQLFPFLKYFIEESAFLLQQYNIHSHLTDEETSIYVFSHFR